MMIEIECVAAFDAQEFAVDTRMIPVVPANNLVVAHAQRGLTPVRTVSADGADVVHFPRPRLISISAAGERAHRADVDAHAALIALEMIFVIRRNLGIHAAVHATQRADSHALIANSHAAEAENATGRIVEDYRRPLLLIDMEFGLLIPAFAGAVAEDHVL